MFGASVSELYLLINSLISTGRAVGLCVITKKNLVHSIHRKCESGLAIIYKHGYNIQACCTQAGPAHAAGRRGGIDR